MKKICIIVVMFFSANNFAYAQTHELGLMISTFNFMKQTSTDISSPNQFNQAHYTHIQPMLQYGFINKKQVELNIQIGYSSLNNHSERFDKSYDGQNVYFQNYSSKTSLFAMRLGIGKRMQWSKILMTSGLNMPFQFWTKQTSNSSNDTYDSLGQYVYHSVSKIQQPAQFISGLYMSQSFYYPVCERLYIGAEFDLGFRVSIANDYISSQSTSTNYSGATPYTSYQNSKKKDKYFATSLQFNPAISLKYQFKNNSK